jgi:hypothetical protein
VMAGKLTVLDDDLAVTLHAFISHGGEHAPPLRNSRNLPTR